MLHVQFKGLLRNVAGCAETTFELPNSRRLEDVLSLMAQTFPGILSASAEYQWRYGSTDILIAVNGEIIEEQDRGVLLQDNDQITLLPPIGGGACTECKHKSAMERN